MPDQANYEIEFRWKEEVIYWEGDRGFVFDGGWGVSPFETYVSSADIWDAAVPGWFKGRRGVVVDRLKADDGHVVLDDPGFRPLRSREVFRPE